MLKTTRSIRGLYEKLYVKLFALTEEAIMIDPSTLFTGWLDKSLSIRGVQKP